MIHRIVSASLSPNTEPDDVFNALGILCTPWKWFDGGQTPRIVQWFAHRYPEYTVYASNSGRSSLYLICKAFGIGPGDEVLVQSFTCVAVPNSILWNGATPVYVDIDETLNLDVRDARAKCTKKTKAILVQHTLGMPADMEKIVDFAKKNKLLLIEDCAHALGASYNGKPLGSFGDASFFSFGRDKIVSSVFGGMGMVKTDRKEANGKMNKLHTELPRPGFRWVLQQLVHPVIFSLVLPLYTLGPGKLLLVLFQKVFLLSFPVYPEEKSGLRPPDFPASYPDALAKLLELQLTKLDRYNNRRKRVAAMYRNLLKNKSTVTLLSYPDDSVYLRFPVMVKNPGAVMQLAKRRGILLGNWYHNVIDPAGVDFAKVHYTSGSCPEAHRIAAGILNLPTNISDDNARRVAELFI